MQLTDPRENEKKMYTGKNGRSVFLGPGDVIAYVTGSVARSLQTLNRQLADIDDVAVFDLAVHSLDPVVTAVDLQVRKLLRHILIATRVIHVMVSRQDLREIDVLLLDDGGDEARVHRVDDGRFVRLGINDLR